MNYTFPEPEDGEGQKISLKTYEQGKATLPKFMNYDASTRTYQIMPNYQVKPQNYTIEISLSDTFAEENFYWFTVRVLPKHYEQELKKDKKMVTVQGIFKLQMIYRDSTAELRF